MISRPEKGEYPAYFQPYIALVPAETDIIHYLSKQKIDFTDFMKKEISSVENDPYAPGKWSVKQLFGHIIDTERIFCHRALFIARGDHQNLPGFEQDDYVNSGNFDSRNYDEMLDEYNIMRDNTIMLFKGFSEEVYQQSGLINGYTTMLSAIPFVIGGHLAHHKNILTIRYTK
ncbi:MAG: DinB family protein [Cyclobacteriaceae bacterium]